MSDDKKGFSLFTKAKAGGSSAGSAMSSSPSLPKPKNVKQRWIFVAGGFLLLAAVGSSMLKEDKAVRVKKEAPVGMVDVTPASGDKRAFEAQFGANLEKLNQTVERMESDAKRKDEELAALREQVRNGGTGNGSTGTTGAPGAPARNTGGLGPIGGGAPDAPPEPPSLPPRLQVPNATTPPSALPPSIPVGTPGAGVPTVPSNLGKPLQFMGPSASDDKTSVEAKTTYKKNENVGRMPLSFASMSLLNGIDAGTSQTTQSNPLPVLISINNHAQLPGLAKYKLKGCFAMGTGYGDLSSERVYVRVSRLSCVDKADGLVLSQEVGGYINDSDGTLGLRGKVEDRQGARLGKALLAGFAQGLAGALGSAQGTSSSSSLTGAVTSSISGSAALRASGLSGAQNAANQLAEFYLKEAQNIFPVIAVENGRTGTLVLTSDSKLEWFNNRDQFIPETTPTKK